MSGVGSFFVRWRVRLGYVVAVIVLWLARPTPRSIFIGALVGLAGLWLRAYAAGYLHKQEILTVTGPYAYTRNPLYLGSAILILGAAISMSSWWSAAILLGYFALVYLPVMKNEERELRQHHDAAFDKYAASVPLFFPRLSATKVSGASPGSFSLQQYRKNHEWQAAIGFLFLPILLFLIWHYRMH